MSGTSPRRTSWSSMTWKSTTTRTSAIFDTWLDGYGTHHQRRPGRLWSARQQHVLRNHGRSRRQAVHAVPAMAATASRRSEVTRTFATAQNWTAYGIKTLTLYFYGAPENGAAQLYLKINGTKIVYTGEAGNIQRQPVESVERRSVDRSGRDGLTPSRKRGHRCHQLRATARCSSTTSDCTRPLRRSRRPAIRAPPAWLLTTR